MEKNRWAKKIDVERKAKSVFSRLADSKKTDVLYDRQSDVLYVNFVDSPPKKADYTLDTGDYVFRYRNGGLIGITVIDALVHFEVGFEDFPIQCLYPETIQRVEATSEVLA